MPVEIKELVIRTVVNDAADAPLNESDGEFAGPASASRGVDTDSIVQECVRQVMRILARNKER